MEKHYAAAWHNKDHVICLLDVHTYDGHGGNTIPGTNVTVAWKGGSPPRDWSNSYTQISWSEFSQKYGVTMDDVLKCAVKEY